MTVRLKFSLGPTKGLGCCWLNCWRGADASSFFWSYPLIPWNKSDINYWCIFFPLLIQWAALRVDGYFPLNSCLALSVLPLNFVSKIKQFFTYFCKPHYCIYCVFLCAEEPCHSHKDPRVRAARLWLDTGSVGEEAVTGRGKLCSLFTWLSYFLGLKQTLLECSSWYLLSDPVECLGYFCFSFRAKKQLLALNPKLPAWGWVTVL